MKNFTSRRSFLQTAATITGGTSLFSLTGATVQGDVAGANDRIRVALVGAGGRGMHLADEFSKLPNVEVVSIVDADINRANGGAEQIEKKYQHKPTSLQDARKMLEDKSIDAVLVATCNHWHSLMAIWACQAGKDVYVEKPCSQNLYEGRKLVEAAKKYNRLVQHGTQRRSSDTWAKVAETIKTEKFGKLIAAKVYANRPRGPLGYKPVTAPPTNIDWDLWLGTAPKQDYHANLTPYNWHWFWDTGNGEIGNNGVHFFDLCLWAIGEKHPDSVIAFGTRFVNDKDNSYKDQAQTPTIQFALYDFGGTPLIFESCNIAGEKGKWNPREEAEFYTEAGVIRGDRIFLKDGKSERWEIDFKHVDYGNVSNSANALNFINAMRNRDSVQLNAPISKGHYSASVCHWGNAAYRNAQDDSLASIRNKMGDNPILNESIDKVLANVNDVFKGAVKTEDIPFKVSPKMKIDTEKERFADNQEANQFLTRIPRKPFDVPDEV
ncbi:MAG: Gfo/Idh/MocA family oxidoreductase [Planctomycetaceae bacterium]|jgi:predicted dehydrogenase|nr:Gfo/Idh/MocA family oxidoreductase [Planctomycetaceae bacterium]